MSQDRRPLLDSVEQSHASETDSSVNGGSMSEVTRLFDVPESQQANPFIELSTQDGFAALIALSKDCRLRQKDQRNW